MKRFWGAAITALVFAAGVASAQNASTTKAIETARKAYEDGYYLKATTTLRPLAIKIDGTIADDMAYQYWTQMSAAIDDAPPEVVRDASSASPLSDAEKVALDDAQFADALPAIVARARGTRLVILNENHSISRHRAFGLAVARALRPLGYDVLAAEALTNGQNLTQVANSMEAIRVRGALTLTDGYYTHDPEFADFFRQAIAIGYVPAAYEATRYPKAKTQAADIANRESQQAANLARLVSAHPASKFLIYVGFSHVAETALTRNKHSTYWMGARLKN